MTPAKMCPFLAIAFARGIQQVPVVGDGKVNPEITCCRENCMWWQGGRCAMQAIVERLDQVGEYLGGLHREMDIA